MNHLTTSRRLMASAFTLLEITVVMFVMAVIVGVSVYSFSGVSGEEALRRPAVEFQSMVQEAMRRASLEEKPQVIEFDAKGFATRYRHAGPGRVAGADGEWIKRVAPPDDMRISLKRWREKAFTPASGQQMELLPGGLCEPLSLRFEQAGSWLEITLHPLTGGVREEALYVKADRL